MPRLLCWNRVRYDHCISGAATIFFFESSSHIMYRKTYAGHVGVFSSPEGMLERERIRGTRRAQTQPLSVGNVNHYPRTAEVARVVLGAGKRWGAPMPVPVEPSGRARSTCTLILTHHNPGIEPSTDRSEGQLNLSWPARARCFARGVEIWGHD